MSCSAQDLIVLAAAGKFFALSERELKMATLFALCNSPGSGATAQQLIDGAMAAGYAKLSDRQLEECILAATCTNMNTQVLDSGLATLAGGTVTVSSASADASRPILLSYFSLNGNAATIDYANVVNGVSFTINSSFGGDTNMVAWAILKP
jgi:hypothetical protein